MRHLEACPICSALTTGSRVVHRRVVEKAATRLDCQFHECSSCSHVFLNPQPTADELQTFYDADYSVFRDEPRSPEAIAALLRNRFDGERLNHARFVRGGRFLDVGCGLGDMVAAMQAAGMEAMGVDPSPIAVEIGRRSGRKLESGTLPEIGLAHESLDSISMYHSLEHNIEPVATLVECARIMKADAVLMVAVPNFGSLAHDWFGADWTALDPPYHLHHFTRRSLARAGERADLVLRQMQTESFLEHQETEFAAWARRRLLVPHRLSMRLHIFRPIARRLYARASTADRGDALVAHFGRAL